MFHSYDRDEDGYITGYEAMKAYERWFGQLKIPNDSSDSNWYVYCLMQPVSHHAACDQAMTNETIREPRVVENR